MAAQKVAAAVPTERLINAVVVSSGLMQKTVKVRIGTQKWNAHIRKTFSRRAHLLVHDPKSSLRTGDIISITPGWRTSKTVHHVVSAIVAPFGEPIEARPPVPTLAERLEEKAERRRIKEERGRLKDESLMGRGSGSEEEIVEGEGEIEAVGLKLGELEVGFEGRPEYQQRIDTRGEEQPAETPAVGEPSVEEVQEEKPAKTSWWR